jgi:YebC/PmpR family DNA-binding regulatory protein
MAGHSKWKNIRLHKGKADVVRAKIFGKLSREITIAARMGGGSPDSNARLRLAIERARENSMPADNIKRATQKGTGEVAGEAFDEVTYEGYGPGGAAVLIEAATDNRNRTVADIRHVFSRNGGSLGESGSVAWQFARKGSLSIDALLSPDEDAVMEAALEAGAEDFAREGDVYEITTSADDVSNVAARLEKAGYKTSNIEVAMVPQNTVSLDGEAARRMLKLMDALEDHDDVQRVAANFDIEENLLQEGADA